jgi:hypothetical protein
MGMWYSVSDPPPDGEWVMLRFDDAFSCRKGFYSKAHQAYYTSVAASIKLSSVSPSHWAKIEQNE